MMRMIIANKTPRAITVIGYCLLVIVLSSCSDDGSQMRQQLEELERQNREYEDFTTDSLAKELVDYFDRHGTANERLRAHYILGCVYRDLGEAPQALEQFHIAVGQIDTTLSDYDYGLLCRVHSQTAYLFQETLLPHSMLEELQIAHDYALKAKDTLAAITIYENMSSPLYRLGMEDSAIAVRQKAYDDFLQLGHPQEAVRAISGNIGILLKHRKPDRAFPYMRAYESYMGNQATQHNIYKYDKGVYYIYVEKEDSAEYMFRGIMSNSPNINETEAAYSGLMMLYKHLNNADSAAKYAELAYTISDSVYKDDIVDKMLRMQSLYNYTTNKNIALKKTIEVSRLKKWLRTILIIASLLALLTYIVISKQKEHERRKRENLTNRLQKMRQAQLDLESLSEKRYEELANRKNNEIQALQEELKKSGFYSITLEERLRTSNIYKLLNDKVEHPSSITLTSRDWEQLKEMIEHEIPRFYGILFSGDLISEQEANLCAIIRLGFKPKQHYALMDIKSSTSATMRKRMLWKIFKEKGSPKDFDKKILNII